MVTHPPIQIDAERQRKLEKLAGQNGRSPSELVRDAIDHYLADQVPPGSNHGDTLYDIAKRTGAVGLLKGGAADVSTNPKYLEGFGPDG